MMKDGQMMVVVYGAISCLFLLSLAPAFASETEVDPFADVAPKAELEAAVPVQPWASQFFTDNFGFRKEIMSQFGVTHDGDWASRQSVGAEVLKKFSSEVKTFASVNLQGRIVRRDHFIGFMNDMEGMDRLGWAFEYHNVYADLYNFLDPLLSDAQQSAALGRFNVRVGRFYLPFGLNLQTDTHGSVLQLSNERNFGFERDWYAGFWGILSEDLNYDFYYLVGSGYDFKYEGQSGLGAARLSLANKYLSESGLEGGLSVMAGQRLDRGAVERSPAVMQESTPTHRVDTWRVGLDGRYRHDIPTGLLTWTSEVSGGRDAPDPVLTQLHQLEYLHASRRFGVATQFRWFWQDLSRGQMLNFMGTRGSTELSAVLEATWYFRNDVGNSNLHWIKVNVEDQILRQEGRKNHVIWTLQYYLYW